MIIAIDFDETLHTGTWPQIGQPKAFAPDTLRRLNEAGPYLIIWTCREGKEQTDAANSLLMQNIPLNRMNDNQPENTRKYGTNTRKVNADLYLDDRQLGGLPDWSIILDMVRDLKR